MLLALLLLPVVLGNRPGHTPRMVSQVGATYHVPCQQCRCQSRAVHLLWC